MSELHKRLEQLVNYSSQLIFVGSDSAANQQKSLSELLALQQDTTEVSFLSASEEQTTTDYRRTICRQLADHTVGSFVRPLYELLKDIDADKGNYLVCISQAQYLDDEFVSELWDWVASSRQMNEGLHLNIILFAEQAWTEQAQNALPDHNSNKPVLLSTQLVDAVGFDVNALENLMAHKRAFFAPTEGESIVKKKWFIAAVLGLFLAIFIVLISIQYPQHVSTFLTTGTLLDENDKLADTLNDTSAPDPVDNIIDDEEAALTEKTTAQLVEPSLVDEILVSTWPGESGAQSDDSLESVNSPEPINSPEPVNNTDRGNEQPLFTEESQKEGDFAVEDITSVGQLDQKLVESIDELPQQAPQTITRNEGSNDSEAAYRFDELQLLTLPPNAILLQLSGMQSASVLQEYLVDNQLTQSTWVYETQRYGGPWYVVLVNQAFDNIESANRFTAQLSTSVQNDGPFAKTVQQVQNEILQVP